MKYKWSYCDRCNDFQGPGKATCRKCQGPAMQAEMGWGPARWVGQIVLLVCLLFGILAVISGLFFWPSFICGALWFIIGLVVFLITMNIDQSGRKKKFTQERSAGAPNRAPPPPPPRD